MIAPATTDRPTLWGMTRASRAIQQATQEVQREQIAAHIAHKAMQGDVRILDEPPNTSSKIPFAQRVCAAAFLQEAKRGDTLIVTRLDRLGRDVRDYLNTVHTLEERGIRLIVLEFDGEPIDTGTAMGRAIFHMRMVFARLERDLIGERTREVLRSLREKGLAISKPGFGQKKIVEQVPGLARSQKRWEWDPHQLELICEIALRLSKHEHPSSIAQDFWERGEKDHRGRLWGVKGNFDPHNPTETMITYPWQRYVEAVRWLHRAKHAGTLPEPYLSLARRIREGSRFTAVRRKRTNTGE